MEQQPPIQKRQTAYIVSVAELQGGTYVTQEGWLPNYVELADNSQISRANVAGVIVSLPIVVEPFKPCEQFSCVIDDGTGRLPIRSFEAVTVADSLSIGTPVLIIGKPRKFNEELSLIAEIVRPIKQSKWLDVRKAQLLHAKKERSASRQTQELEVLQSQTYTQATREEKYDGIKPAVPEEKVTTALDVIDALDRGEGVLMDEAIAALHKQKPDVDAKKRIMQLLLNGDLFEIRPGRVKVLK
ncbi:MAG TPA: hypothetical protein VK158_05750 [Acidobacteriota bacterium]|nr:hypothetical protein [Acidobacteriota bacterium]